MTKSIAIGILRRLWNDDRAAVVSTELTMILGITVAGLTSGLVAVRNNVNRQLTAVSSLPDAVIPTAADLQSMIAVQPPPYAAKSLNYSQASSASNSTSGANVSLVVNVQYPSNFIPPPSP
jgi:hypothetical protein